MRRLCIGDIHGNYDKTLKVLDFCKFSDSDVLYSTGDFCDRGRQNVKTIDFLMSLNNLFPVVGNHDLWNYEYLSDNMTRDGFDCWYNYNGGFYTVKEEKNKDPEWKFKVATWLKNLPFMIDINDKVIIHSVAPKTIYESRANIPLTDITTGTLKTSRLVRDEVYDDNVWGRSIINGCEGYTPIGARRSLYNPYIKDCYKNTYTGNPIYIIGHTPLDKPFYDKDLGIIGIDTGGFLDIGYITVLDIDTLEFWTSNSKDTQNLLEVK